MDIAAHGLGHRHTSHFNSGLNILFLSAFPLLLWVFQGSFTGMATALLQIWIFAMALRLISRGQKIHDAYDDAPEAKRPVLPRKLVGSCLIGLMVFLLAGHHFVQLWAPIAAGVMAIVLSVSAFGLDPMHDKEASPEVKAAQAIRAAEATIEAADVALDTIADDLAELGDADLLRRTEATRDVVITVMRGVGPSGVPRIQKPVDKIVALLRDEAQRLQDARQSGGFAFARKRYLAKLAVMTESFEQRARKSGVRFGRDAFDREADLLMDRMPSESAA